MNKSIIHSIVLLLALFSACHRPLKVVEPAETPSPVLTAIDSLMWQKPDSALVQLLAYLDDSCCSADSDRHFAHVLLAELFYKNYYPQENHEELLQAVGYFDSVTATSGWASTRGVSLRDIFISARAHYINGVGYYENDSAVQACTEYIHTHKNRKKYQKLLQHRTEIHTFAAG